MPGRVVLFVKLLLDVGGDVLLDVVLLERLGSAVHGVLLHFLGHVRILDHCLPVRHLEAAEEGFREAQLGFKGSQTLP